MELFLAITYMRPSADEGVEEVLVTVGCWIAPGALQLCDVGTI